MRLLYITPGFPAHEKDFNCLPPLQDLVRNLTAKGADIQIIALEYPFQKKPYNWHGAMVWPCNGRNKKWKKPLTIYRALNHAHNLWMDDHFDCVHTFWLTLPTEIGQKVAEDWKIPHFMTMMGQDVFDPNIRYQKLKPEHAPNMIALSKYQSGVFEEIAEFAPGNIIPWGLELGRLEIGNSKLGTGNPKLPEGIAPEEIEGRDSADEPITNEQFPIFNQHFPIIGVGSLLEVKNWYRWLYIISLLVEEQPEIQTLIIGSGPLERELKEKVKFAELEDNIKFAGELPRPEVMKIMRQANTLLHTSDYESFGMVLIEALANGCRVVSTPVGIAPELPETFASEDDEALVQALLENLQKPRLEKPSVPFPMNDCGWAHWDLYHREYLK